LVGRFRVAYFFISFPCDDEESFSAYVVGLACAIGTFGHITFAGMIPNTSMTQGTIENFFCNFLRGSLKGHKNKNPVEECDLRIIAL